MKHLLLLSLLSSSFLWAEGNVESQLTKQNELINKLEQRLKNLEDQNYKTRASSARAASLPEIGLILDTSFVARNIDNVDYSQYSIPGFVDSGDAELPFNANRGFNLNYAELSVSSVVSPSFDAAAFLHIEPTGIEIDEAYIATRALPYGFKARVGQLKSNIGRHNEKHHHTWSFSATPLIYDALFSAEGLSDAGVQLQWVADTNQYFMMGVEALQGTNGQSFGYEKSNNVYTTYIKHGFDMTDTTTVFSGLSYVQGKNPNGNTLVYGADLTLQSYFSSYSSLTWQSEYLHREMETATIPSYQGGYYTQLVYAYNQRQKVGIRYDEIVKNEIENKKLYATTLMFEHKPFEFSRFRLEYTYDKSKFYNSIQKDVHELKLSFTVAIGSHTAHSF